RPAEERNRRSLSRTVSCGTPLAAAIDRNPCPRAARASMSPITAVPSHRRASTHAGRRTCVTPHRPHRARRGRTPTPTRPPPRPPSAPPPPDPPPPPTQKLPALPQTPPQTRRAVAYREQRCLQAPHGPPRTSGKGNGEGRPETDTLTVSSHATLPQPEPP